MPDPGSFDLIVVGAGPAGSAAALAALRAGRGSRVLLLDRAQLGRDKVCGDGIAPHAVTELEALGVTAVRDTEMVAAVRLVAPGGAHSSAITTSPGYVVPRARFDERLARAAMEAGADFHQEKVQTLTQNDLAVVVNERYRAPVVIGADGSNSIVRRLVGEPSNKGKALAVAIRGYALTPVGAKDELVIRWDSQRSGGLCYAWAFPTDHGTTNVGYGMSAAAADHGRARLEKRMAELLPEYDLTGVEFTGHTLPLTVARPKPATGRVLLVGDAASLINPFTGEGIYSALVSGALAGAAAVEHSDSVASVYARSLARRFGRQHRQMKLLYPLINYRIVLNTVIRACQEDRRMFDRLLAVGLGDAAFTLADLIRFGRYARRPAA